MKKLMKLPEQVPTFYMPVQVFSLFWWTALVLIKTSRGEKSYAEAIYKFLPERRNSICWIAESWGSAHNI